MQIKQLCNSALKQRQCFESTNMAAKRPQLASAE